jgi:hypothetical protein
VRVTNEAPFAVDVDIWWGSGAKSIVTVAPLETQNMTGHPNLPAATVAVRYDSQHTALSFTIKEDDIYTQAADEIHGLLRQTLTNGAGAEGGADGGGGGGANGGADDGGGGGGGGGAQDERRLDGDVDGTAAIDIDEDGGADASGADSVVKGSAAESTMGTNRLELLKELRCAGTRMDDLSDHRSMDVVISLVSTQKEAVRYTAALATVIKSTTHLLLQVCVGDDATPRASRCIHKGGGKGLLGDHLLTTGSVVHEAAPPTTVVTSNVGAGDVDGSNTPNSPKPSARSSAYEVGSGGHADEMVDSGGDAPTPPSSSRGSGGGVGEQTGETARDAHACVDEEHTVSVWVTRGACLWCRTNMT